MSQEMPTDPDPGEIENGVSELQHSSEPVPDSVAERPMERLPTKEEIQSVFEEILKGQRYTESRVVIDEKGVQIYEIKVFLQNGEITEYNYQRAKHDLTDTSSHRLLQSSGSIHATYYDSSGMPISAEGIAEYRNGTWEFILPEDIKKKEGVTKGTKVQPENVAEQSPSLVIEKFESLVAAFESTHSLDALRAIAVLSVEDAPSHPIREPAHKDLAPIFKQRKVLGILRDEGKISPEEYEKLEQKWKVLSAAVGVIRTLEGNRVDHDIDRKK